MTDQPCEQLTLFDGPYWVRTWIHGREEPLALYETWLDRAAAEQEAWNICGYY